MQQQESSEHDTVAPRGNFHFHLLIFPEFFGHRILGIGLAVYQEGAGRRLKPRYPGQEFALACVSGQPAERLDPRLDHVLLIEQFDAPGAIYDDPPQGSPGLITGKNDGIALVPDALLEMMTDSPPYTCRFPQ